MREQAKFWFIAGGGDPYQFIDLWSAYEEAQETGPIDLDVGAEPTEGAWARVQREEADRAYAETVEWLNSSPMMWHGGATQSPVTALASSPDLDMPKEENVAEKGLGDAVERVCGRGMEKDTALTHVCRFCHSVEFTSKAASADYLCQRPIQPSET